VTIRIGVYQVSHKLVAFTVDMLLAGMMEVELFQSVGLVANRECAAGCVIDLYGVAIVDDVQRYGVVIELERWKVRLLGALDVDG